MTELRNIAESTAVILLFYTNLYILVIISMKDPRVLSFRATGHSTCRIELNVYFHFIVCKLMTSSSLSL